VKGPIAACSSAEGKLQDLEHNCVVKHHDWAAREKKRKKKSKKGSVEKKMIATNIIISILQKYEGRKGRVLEDVRRFYPTTDVRRFYPTSHTHECARVCAGRV
jgi:hypothetical protein